MICELYSLKKEYLDKKVYIWNVNRDSIVLFMMLAFRRIDIQGFITLQEEYKGDIYMNRPVFTLNQVEWDDDSVIFVSDNVSKDKINVLNGERIVYWSDAIGINDELRQKKVIIYGTGDGAKKLCRVLDKEKIDVELYCVTKKNNAMDYYKGKKIIESSELGNYKDCAVVISVLDPQYRREILETLSDFHGRIYGEDIFRSETNKYALANINFIQIIDNAVKMNKKIYIYGRKNLLAELIENVLSIYGIKINGYVYDSGDREKGIMSIYELAYEGIEDKLIIINEESPERLIRVRENIEFAGFSLEKENYTGLQWYTRAKEELLLELKYYKDSLVGHSIIYPQGKPGWKIYGEEKKDGINIIVLGGSTSAEVWCPENWVSKLYNKLNKNNIRTTIYNGAHEGNDIVQEILRLLRDGYALKPDIVISLSGVNNLRYKQVDNLFNIEDFAIWFRSLTSEGICCNGVCCKESLYSFWSRNVSLLKAISEVYGASFFGFLQPMNITMENMSLREKSMHEEEQRSEEGIREFRQFACDNEDYINLMRLFEHKEGMFFDDCHYTDMANEVIANKIYEAIIPTIQTINNV